MPNVTELIRITGVSPYSVFSGSTRFSFNKGLDSSMFVKGSSYSVETYVNDKGNKVISKLLNCLGTLGADVGTASPLDASANQLPAAQAAPAFSPFKKKAFVPYAKKADAMSKEDWAVKDRSQLIGGRSHDAAQLVHASLVTGTPIEQVIETYKATLIALVNMASEVK